MTGSDAVSTSISPARNPSEWAVALVALVANASVVAFLSRHRADDINMRSAGLCSRNDVIANGGVLLAALGVGLTGSAWPDILVGLAIAVLVGASAVGVIREALAVPQPFPAAEACRAACTPKAAPPTAGSASRAKHLDRVTWRTGRPRLGAHVPAARRAAWGCDGLDAGSGARRRAAGRYARAR